MNPFQLSKRICLSVIALVILVGITACSHSDTKDKDGKAKSVEVLYSEAMDKLKDESYNTAIELFEEVERIYPYSKWAIEAKLMAAYASYQDEEYDNAVLALDRFIKLHPGNKNISYAYYLKALCYYEQVSTVTRDQSFTVLARSALKEVSIRFPRSKYAKDAKIKLDLVVDHLAGKELEVGRFYLKEGKMIAAINRFKRVIEDFETTSHIPEALHRLVESYLLMGVVVEAKKYAAVLGHNFPGSSWYQYSYDLVGGTTVPSGTVKVDVTQEPKWYEIDLPDLGFSVFSSDSKEDASSDASNDLAEPPIQK